MNLKGPTDVDDNFLKVPCLTLSFWDPSLHADQACTDGSADLPPAKAEGGPELRQPPGPRARHSLPASSPLTPRPVPDVQPLRPGRGSPWRPECGEPEGKYKLTVARVLLPPGSPRDRVHLLSVKRSALLRVWLPLTRLL